MLLPFPPFKPSFLQFNHLLATKVSIKMCQLGPILCPQLLQLKLHPMMHIKGNKPYSDSPSLSCPESKFTSTLKLTLFSLNLLLPQPMLSLSVAIKFATIFQAKAASNYRFYWQLQCMGETILFLYRHILLMDIPLGKVQPTFGSIIVTGRIVGLVITLVCVLTAMMKPFQEQKIFSILKTQHA